MDKRIKTVIIDDGINEKLYDTGSLWLDLEITRDLKVQQRSGNSPYEPSHGTTCSAIIKKYSPDVELGSIKVLNEDSKRGIRNQLVTALLWCADHGVRLVSLSLGSTDFRDREEILKAVNRASRKGVIIIAACDNKNVFTYPASLSNAIGVKCHEGNILKEGQYIYNHYPIDGIDVTACSNHLLMNYSRDDRITPSCNSFAAPMITALVHNILKQNPSLSLEEIKYKLAEGAINSIPENWSANIQPRADWIESAFLFDINPSYNAGSCFLIDILPDKNIHIESTNNDKGITLARKYLIDNRDQFKGIETIIVNTCDEDNTDMSQAVSCLLDTLEDMQINLVLLNDSLSTLHIGRTYRGIKVYRPDFDVGVLNQGSGCINVPIIEVCDYTGIYYLNILYSLKNMFQMDGYNAIAVSDTCRGVISGIEYLFSAVNRDVSCSSNLSLIYRLYGPDIIIAGINAVKKSPGSIYAFERRYGIDIKIIVFNEEDQSTEGAIDSSDESKIIVVPLTSMGDNCREKSMINVKQLYDQIISLFQEEK